MRKPFDVHAEGLVLKNSRGERICTTAHQTHTYLRINGQFGNSLASPHLRDLVDFPQITEAAGFYFPPSFFRNFL
jgi:hypothetical protein